MSGKNKEPESAKAGNLKPKKEHEGTSDVTKTACAKLRLKVAAPTLFSLIYVFIKFLLK
jgi:hypothetical protein